MNGKEREASGMRERDRETLILNQIAAWLLREGLIFPREHARFLAGLGRGGR